MIAELSARALGVLAASPGPSSQPQIQGPVDNNNGSGAGTIGLLLILGLIVVSVGLFFAMNRSIKRARRNLGGDQLPRRPPTNRPVIPIRDDDPPRPH